MANERTDHKKGGTVKVTLVKSPTGFKRNQGLVVLSMGLRRIRHTVEGLSPLAGLEKEIRGLVQRVADLEKKLEERD